MQTIQTLPSLLHGLSFFCLVYCKNWLNQSRTFSPHFPSDSRISPSELVALSVCSNRAEYMLWSLSAGGVSLLPLVSFLQALPLLRGWSIFQEETQMAFFTCFSLPDSCGFCVPEPQPYLSAVAAVVCPWFLGWNIHSPSTSLSLLSLVWRTINFRKPGNSRCCCTTCS